MLLRSCGLLRCDRLTHYRTGANRKSIDMLR